MSQAGKGRLLGRPFSFCRSRKSLSTNDTWFMTKLDQYAHNLSIQGLIKKKKVWE
jgi:hypothetical protein